MKKQFLALTVLFAALYVLPAQDNSNQTAPDAIDGNPVQMTTDSEEHYKKDLEVIERYYAKTWSDLLWFLGVTFGVAFCVIGILMPIMLQKLQYQSNEKELERLKGEYNSLIKKYTEENEKRFREVEDMYFYLHGLTFVTNGDSLKKSGAAPERFLYEYFFAAHNFILSKRGEELSDVIDTITNIINSDNFPSEIAPVYDNLDIYGLYKKLLIVLSYQKESEKCIWFSSLLKEKIKFKH